MTSGNNVSVDVVPRHILDICPVITHGSVYPSGSSQEDNTCKQEDGDGGEGLGMNQCIDEVVGSQRIRKPPIWMYDCTM